ncbi:hypothetical protein B0H19DRAFT_1084987 [Mycena capillaripes]|nr:hypothetical protein B0H19DRAFT_1084987 [Mycena capillaripes]
MGPLESGDDSLAVEPKARNSCLGDKSLLSRLYIPVDLDISGPLTETRVQEAMRDVKKVMEAWIDHEIEHSSRTKELLSNHLEMDKETGRMVKKSLDFRHYLRVKTGEHRRALTRMVLSSHSIAVERRRWKERGKNIVPLEWRLCRFCEEEVEDPAHAMFMYDHPPLIQLREVFLTKLYTEVPTIRGHRNAHKQSPLYLMHVDSVCAVLRLGCKLRWLNPSVIDPLKIIAALPCDPTTPVSN